MKSSSVSTTTHVCSFVCVYNHDRWNLFYFFQLCVAVDELIQLTENVASTMAVGTNDPESMSVLLHNLRIHGPQLEALSKDTLDRAFVTFRNASQDERLNIMTRLNLLELVELRAKSWHNSDGSKTYYKHKANNVEVSAD